MLHLEEIFAAEGRLARSVSAYAPRNAQLAMAGRIAEALEVGGHLAVEAGTGTGKTFAYLVPALLSGRRIIVSTATKTLQEQLFRRDLPTVSGALGRPVRVALLKGRANYLCRHRLGLASESDRYGGAQRDAVLAAIEVWAGTTASGEISELDAVSDQSPLWSRVTSTADNCLGQRCEHYEQCFVVRARRQALEADVVIVNHHLLLADMALKEEGFAALLPGADAVIVDEAHQFADVAAEFFGVAAGSRQLERLVEDTTAESLALPGQHQGLADTLGGLGKAVREARLCMGAEAGGRRDWAELGDVETSLERVIAALEHLADLLEEVAEASPGLGNCLARARSLTARWTLFVGEEQTEGLRWAELARRSFTLRLTPFDVSESLHTLIHARPCGWIFTSATLAVGEDFGYFLERIGVPDAERLRLDSPFDYAAHAMLYLPADMPEPGTAHYTAACVERCVPLLTASRGGAFMLFTSHRALREAAALLAAPRHGLDHLPLLVQGTAPRDRLLARFREAGDALLLGTASFWEGVDVRGDALRLVVIDKLPFAPPDEPVLRARLEAIRRAGGNPFREHQLPEAVLTLKQGVGRLIRDVSDRGLVVICDPRLVSRGYGRLFLDSLPPMPRTRDAEEAIAFLSRCIPVMAGAAQ